MNFAKRIERIFLGERREEEKEAELAHYKAKRAHDAQVVQSGARVIGHMSNALQLMAEGHAKK